MSPRQPSKAVADSSHFSPRAACASPSGVPASSVSPQLHFQTIEESALSAPHAQCLANLRAASPLSLQVTHRQEARKRYAEAEGLQGTAAAAKGRRQGPRRGRSRKGSLHPRPRPQDAAQQHHVPQPYRPARGHQEGRRFTHAGHPRQRVRHVFAVQVRPLERQG